MRESQYRQQASMARSGVSAQQLLLAQQSQQQYSRTAYGDRGADPYVGAGSSSSLSSSRQYASQYPAPTSASRAAEYLLASDVADYRLLSSERRASLAEPAYASQSLLDPRSTRGLSYSAQYGRSALPATVGEQPELVVRDRRGDVASAVYAQARGHPAYPASDLIQPSRVAPVSVLDGPLVGPDGLGVPGRYPSGGRRLAPSGYGGRDLGLVSSVAGRGDVGPYLQPYDDFGLKRSRLSMIESSLQADMYSNYRLAKARRTGADDHYARASAYQSERREDRDRYRERRRNRISSPPRRERARKSPPSSVRKEKEKVSVPKDGDTNSVDPAKKASGGTPGRSRGKEQRNKRSKEEKTRVPEPSKRAANLTYIEDAAQKVDQKDGDLQKDNNSVLEKDVENEHESDRDSELGSLCADGSDSEKEKVKKKKKKKLEEQATVIDGPLDGMIFGCSSATFHECMKLRLFGLPVKSKDLVMRVAPGTKLFLFNFDTKELSGIFEAVSHGGMQIDPEAFNHFGGFPAQVRVGCTEQCPNLPISAVKPVIRDNYINQHKFRFDLNATQVKELVKLFRRAAKSKPLQQGVFPDFLSPNVRSRDVLLRDALQQGQPYSPHLQARLGLSTKSKVRPKRQSRKTRKERKKRNLINGLELLKADSSSFHNVLGEIGVAEVPRNDSKSSDGDDTSKKIPNVIVSEVVGTDNSQNVEQPKDIIETLVGNSASDGRDLPGTDGLIASNPGKFPEAQSDLQDKDGKQISFIKDGSNDGKSGLAGSRTEEQGKGLNVPKGAVPADVITRQSDSAPYSSIPGEHCVEVQGVVTAVVPQALVGVVEPLESQISVCNQLQIVEAIQCRPLVPDGGLGDGETKGHTSIGEHRTESVLKVVDKFSVGEDEDGLYRRSSENAQRMTGEFGKCDTLKVLSDASGGGPTQKGKGTERDVGSRGCGEVDSLGAGGDGKESEQILGFGRGDAVGLVKAVGDRSDHQPSRSSKDGVSEMVVCEVPAVGKVTVETVEGTVGREFSTAGKGKDLGVIATDDFHKLPGGFGDGGVTVIAVDVSADGAAGRGVSAVGEDPVVIVEDAVGYESSAGGEEEELPHGPPAAAADDVIVIAEDTADYESSTSGEEEDVEECADAKEEESPDSLGDPQGHELHQVSEDEGNDDDDSSFGSD